LELKGGKVRGPERRLEERLSARRVGDARKAAGTGPEKLLPERSRRRRRGGRTAGRAPEREAAGRSIEATAEEEGWQVTPRQWQWSEEEEEDQAERTAAGSLVTASFSASRTSRSAGVAEEEASGRRTRRRRRRRMRRRRRRWYGAAMSDGGGDVGSGRERASVVWVLNYFLGSPEICSNFFVFILHSLLLEFYAKLYSLRSLLLPPFHYIRCFSFVKQMYLDIF
jgi:hypothetical protein